MSPMMKAALVGAAAAGLSSVVVSKFINPSLGGKIPAALQPLVPALTGALIAVAVSKAL
jgi:uncharacterized membrane protein YeaQ/YmgE (transglycosylase-associated protein family)